jgi:serine protein kinase
MRNSLATRSRKPIWNPIRITVKTCSIATWIMPMPGPKIRTSRTPTPANRELLNHERTKIEKPAGIANPKDFRNQVVKFSLRSRAQNSGKNPTWTSYEKIREVIEKRILSQVEDLLPVISFGSKKDGDTEKKHGEFVQRMVGRGYTERQVRRLVEWYMRVKQAG